jgi:hypothetical protein
MDNLRSTQMFESFQQKSLAKNHSVLAMRAAKQMRRSKHKVKTGHTVCRHLLLMINEPDSLQPEPRASRRFHEMAGEHSFGQKSMGPQSSRPQNTGQLVGVTDLFSLQAIQQSAANDLQFSLGF